MYSCSWLSSNVTTFSIRYASRGCAGEGKVVLMMIRRAGVVYILVLGVGGKGRLKMRLEGVRLGWSSTCMVSDLGGEAG